MGVLTPRLVSSAPGVSLMTSPHRVYGLQTSRSDKQIFCVRVLLKVEGPAVRGYMDWGYSGKRLLTSSHAAAPSIQPWSFHHLRHRNTHTGISPVPNIYSTIPHTHTHTHTDMHTYKQHIQSSFLCRNANIKPEAALIQLELREISGSYNDFDILNHVLKTLSSHVMPALNILPRRHP